MFALLARLRVRISFFVVAFLLLANWYLQVRPRDPLSWSDSAGLAGTALVVLGALLRSWAAGVVHKNTELATEGPFSLVRHPLYVGSLLMALGFCIIVGAWINLWGVLALFALVYVPQLRAEERTLHLLFGEAWLAYRQRTAMFWPRALPPRLRGHWTLEAWLDKSEYRALIAAALGLIALDVLAALGS